MRDTYCLEASIRMHLVGLMVGLTIGLFAVGHAAVAVPSAMQAPDAPSDSIRTESAPKATDTGNAPEGFTRVDRKLTYTKIENRLSLREPFNAAKGKIRVVSFLSPTCPRCLAAAADIQRHFLAKNTSDEFQMFAVWVKITDTDTEASITTAMQQIPDPRVQHYWDPNHVLNAQLIDAVAFEINMRIFDLHLMYDRDAVWEKRLPRPEFFLQEVKGLDGPAWNIQSFVIEVDHALQTNNFSRPSP